MPNTLLRRRYVGRAAQTGETLNQARAALVRLGCGTPPIPDAATDDQAFLESFLLEKLGRCRYSQWWSPPVPFMLNSVTPLPNEIVVRIPLAFLPDVICDIMPRWVADEEDEGYAEVSGIAGLRFWYERGRVILGRLGFPGRIVIPVKPNIWQKACGVATDLLDDPDQIRAPWLTTPAKLHPVESCFVEAWPRRFSPDGSAYRNNQLASQLLRRLPGLCPRPRARFHDLWINRIGDHCSVQFEWMNGPSHAAVLKRFLDPMFNPGAKIDLLDGQTIADVHSYTGGYVTVRSSSQPTTNVDFRRLISTDRQGSMDMGNTNDLRAHRAASEKKHGYRIQQCPSPISRRGQACDVGSR